MPGARRKEGPRAPLFYSVIGLIAAWPVTAQQVDSSDLQLCASLETAELKLACFEALAATAAQKDKTVAPPAAEAPAEAIAVGAGAAVIASERDNIEPANPNNTDAGTAIADEDVGADVARDPPDEMPAGPAPVELPPADVVADDTDAAASVAPAAAGVAAVESVPEPVSAVPAATDTGDPMQDLGKEDIEHKEEPAAQVEDEVVIATVNEVTRGNYDILYFHFANGQVWRQSEKRHFPYPRDGAFEVEIDTGMMGDYQMRIGGEGRMTRIKRVE